MRKVGRINEISSIERAIKRTGCYTVPQDSSIGFRQLFGISAKKEKPSVYSKVYEVYLEKRAKELVEREDILGLFDIDQVFVRFWYDYRVNTAEVKVRDKEITKLYKFIPIIEKKIVKLEDLDSYHVRSIEIEQEIAPKRII